MNTEQQVAFLRSHGWVVQAMTNTRLLPIKCQRMGEELPNGRLWARAPGKRRGFCLNCAEALTKAALARSKP